MRASSMCTTAAGAVMQWDHEGSAGLARGRPANKATICWSGMSPAHPPLPTLRRLLRCAKLKAGVVLTVFAP